jgi:hypothetical protein
LSRKYLGQADTQDYIPPKEPEVLFVPAARSLCIQGHPEWAAEGSEFMRYTRMLTYEKLLHA